jgi:hypothetical protein
MEGVTDPHESTTDNDRAMIKRRAGSALRQAGRAHLADLGIRLASSTPRQWLGDRGWWLINVEFQASSWSVGSYLNVGIQYLWTVTDHRSFGHGNPRFAIPGCGQFAALDGPEDQVRANAEAVAHAARTAVIQLTEHANNEQSHLTWLSQQTGAGFWQDLDAAIATGLLGLQEQATSKLLEFVRRLDPAVAWQAALAPDCEHLAEQAHSPERFRAEIDERIAKTRSQLKLPPRDDSH